MRTWTIETLRSDSKSISLSRAPSRSLNGLMLVLSFSIATVVPLMLFLIYRNEAQKAGIVLQTGCEGAENVFGILSGILMAIQLRFMARN